MKIILQLSRWGKTFPIIHLLIHFYFIHLVFHIAIQEILIEPFSVPGAGGTAVSVLDMVLSWNLLSVNEAAHTRLMNYTFGKFLEGKV